jgi:hypothetical protein
MEIHSVNEMETGELMVDLTAELNGVPERFPFVLSRVDENPFAIEVREAIRDFPIGVHERDTTVIFPYLTRRQLLSVLLDIGITEADVLAHIDQIEDAYDREQSRIDFTASSVFQRDYPLIDMFAQIFGLPSEQVDALWMHAAGPQEL